MVEFPAACLQTGDEFTKDNGVTWHTVRVVRPANRGKRIVVIATTGHELILKPEQLLIVK